MASRDAQAHAELLTRHRPWPRTAAARLVMAAALLCLAPAALAADPSPAPAATNRPATCAERFPADGPAGVDLRLGCIVGEVVGLYIPNQAAPPAPLSTYVILLGIVIAAVLLLAWITGRLIAQRAGRRLAPTLAAEWWVCASCRSVNGANVARCYSCGSPPPGGPALLTDDHPNIPQSFGSTRKRG